jgi:hypothetical protein
MCKGEAVGCPLGKRSTLCVYCEISTILARGVIDVVETGYTRFSSDMVKIKQART